mmetsp:Transcript_35923/g.107340  ORF Transcript_35923/g.107340 Transcript_35923/m.107340 type:complete len:150 (+) Transcript_35923:1655-2104(+)
MTAVLRASVVCGNYGTQTTALGLSSKSRAQTPGIRRPGRNRLGRKYIARRHLGGRICGVGDRILADECNIVGSDVVDLVDEMKTSCGGFGSRVHIRFERKLPCNALGSLISSKQDRHRAEGGKEMVGSTPPRRRFLPFNLLATAAEKKV